MPLYGLHASDDNYCTRLLFFTMNLVPVPVDPSVHHELSVSQTQQSKEEQGLGA